MEGYEGLHELVDKLEHLQASRYYIVAPVAVLYFDSLLTISLEIDRFWRRRLTGPTVLFLINRYFPILAFIPTVMAYFSDTITPEECKKRVLPFVVGSNVISQCVIAIVLALRTYALYQRRRSILLTVSLAWAAAAAIGAWGASCIAVLELPPGIPGCVLHAPDELKFRLAAAYAGSLTFDALIYGMTLWRSYSLREARYCLGLSGDSLLHLILRDSSLYFFVLLGANILSILLICLAGPSLRVINVTFTHIIPVTITSRLLLNLRKDMRREGMTSDPDMITLTSVGEADLHDAALGNIDESFVNDTENFFSEDTEQARP